MCRFWFKEEERSRKFVELTHNCASIDFTQSFWNLVDNGPLAVREREGRGREGGGRGRGKGEGGRGRGDQ